MKKLLIILLACISLNVWADQWYVATTGSDTHGKGTLADPWLTGKHAADTVTGANFVGDTITFGGGTFNEGTNRIDLGAGVSIFGTGETTVILSSYNPNNMSDATIRLNSASGEPVDGAQSISYIKLDGNSLAAESAICVNFRRNVLIHHCTILDFSDMGIRFNCSNGGAYNIAPTNTNATGNEVHDCTITNCTTRSASLSGLIRIEGTDGAKIYNNTLNQSTRAAGQNGNILSGWWNKATQVYDNDFTKNDDEGTGWNFFAEFHYSRGGWDVYNNDFHGAATFDFSGSIKGTYNYGARFFTNRFLVSAPVAVDENYSPAITLESFDTEDYIYIFANLFDNCRGGVYINTITTSANHIWIYYNKFRNIGQTTNNFSFGIQIQSTAPISNLNILNNVIDAGTEAYDGIGVYTYKTITNSNIRNNIINGNFEGYAVALRLSGDTTAAKYDTLRINANDFYGGVHNSIYYQTGVSVEDSTTTGNLTSDPLFRSSSDFHLQSGSPCIDAGLDVGLTEDFSGNRLYGDSYDIGAHEHGIRRMTVDGHLVTRDGKYVMIEQ